MLRRDRDAVLCDLAQYYHIFRLDALPAADVARLAAGLPPDSRIMRILSGRTATMDQILAAAIADRLGLLVWFQTKDGQKGRKRPERILDALLTGEKDPPGGTGSETAAFDSIEAFEAARERLIRLDRDPIEKDEENDTENPAHMSPGFTDSKAPAGAERK